MDANAKRESTFGWRGRLDTPSRLPCAARPELLDLPNPDPDALRGNLADLARVNRFLGGTRLSARALSRLIAHYAPGTPVRLVDIGTGAADIPDALLASALLSEHPLHAIAIDRSLPILQLARGAVPGTPLVAADGHRLPLRDDATDVAHCSLLLHHFDPPEAVPVLAEMARVARLGIIVNDLTRSRIGLAGAWILGNVATRNPLTRHDAPLSARRAYTVDEITDLLKAAGLRVLTVDTAFGYRAAVTAVKP